MHFPWWLSGKESDCYSGDKGSIPGLGRSPGGGSPVFLPGEFHGQEEPGGLQSMGSQSQNSPQGCKESDRTERVNNNNK